MKTIYRGAFFLLLAATASAQVGSPLPSTTFTRGFLRSSNGISAAIALGFSTNATVATNVTVTNLTAVSVTNFDGSIASATGMTADMTSSVLSLGGIANIFVETNGNDSTAVVGDKSHPFQSLYHAVEAGNINFTNTGVPSHFRLGKGVFDIGTNAYIWPAKRSTISGSGRQHTTIYSTNSLPSDTVNLLVMDNDTTWQDFTIWSQPASSTNITVPCDIYGGTNITIRQLKIRGESDGIFVNAVGTTSSPKVKVYDTEFDTTWDAVYHNPTGGNPTAQAGSYVELYNCGLYITRTNIGSDWSAALSASCGSIRMFGGVIVTTNNPNRNHAAYNKAGTPKIELHGVSIVPGGVNYSDSTNVLGAVVFDGCTKADGSPFVLNGPATVSIPATNAPAAGKVLTSDGSKTYWGAVNTNYTDPMYRAELNTNYIKIIGAGTTSSDGIYVWNGSDKYANGSRFLTNNGSYWILGLSTLVYYTNATLYGQWTAGASGSAPGPYGYPLQRLVYATNVFADVIYSGSIGSTNVSAKTIGDFLSPTISSFNFAGVTMSNGVISASSFTNGTIYFTGTTNAAPAGVTIGTTAPDSWEVKTVGGTTYYVPMWTAH